MSTVKNEADAGMFAGVRRWFRRDTQEQTAAAGMPEEQAREIANRYYEEMGFSRPDFLSVTRVKKGAALIYRFEEVGRFNPGMAPFVSVSAKDGTVSSDLKPYSKPSDIKPLNENWLPPR
jgi:hypothetical protein